MKAETGENCPVTGFWRPGVPDAERVFVFATSIMPEGASGPISWHLDDSPPEARFHPHFGVPEPV